jgi:hypothetical protein
MGTDSQQRSDITTESVNGPVSSTAVFDWCVDEAFFVSGQEREIKSNPFMDVLGVAVLLGFGAWRQPLSLSNLSIRARSVAQTAISRSA